MRIEGILAIYWPHRLLWSTLLHRSTGRYSDKNMSRKREATSKSHEFIFITGTFMKHKKFMRRWKGCSHILTRSLWVTLNRALIIQGDL